MKWKCGIQLLCSLELGIEHEGFEMDILGPNTQNVKWTYGVLTTQNVKWIYGVLTPELSLDLPFDVSLG